MPKKLILLALILFSVNIFAQDIEVCTATTDQILPRIASIGPNFLLAWEDSRAGVTNKNIFGQVVANDGSITASPFALCVQPRNQFSPDVATLGDDFFVLFGDAADELKYRFADAEAMGDGPETSIELSGEPEDIRVAAGASQYMAVWSEDDVIKGVIINSDGSHDGSAFIIGTSTNQQTNPDICRYDEMFCVVWAERDRSTGDRSVMGRYFNADGSAFDDAFIVDEGVYEPSAPAVASSGTSVLCGYKVDNASTDNDIMGKIITPGEDHAPFIITNASGTQNAVSLAFGRSNYLAVFEDYADTYYADINGRWISNSGSPVGEVVSISSYAAAQNTPAVEYGLANFMVAWVDRRAGGGDIYARVVEEASSGTGPSGTIGEPTTSSFVANPLYPITMTIEDSDGVDASTIEFSVNGTVYTTDDAELEYSGSELVFTPSENYADADTIECQLLQADDLTGERLSATVSWFFFTDLSGPYFTGPNPPNESTQPSRPAMYTINAFDNLSGINPLTMSFQTNDVDLTYPATGLYWDGITFALMFDSLSTIPDVYENTITVVAYDEPDYGEPNRGEFTWTYNNLSNIYETKPDEFEINSNYPNPFNAGTIINIPQLNGTHSSIEIVDMYGNVIDILESNSGTFHWVPSDVISGLYFYRFSSHGTMVEGKLLYIK